jgi:signal transduction histidine kinase
MFNTYFSVVMDDSKIDIEADIKAISSIDVVPLILDVVCRTTGMGFAAIARVTEDKWITCAVLDKINFGLKPGGELKLETTICNEIRQHQQPVVIDHVAKNKVFANHHTPALYGFQSYISVPIILKNGRFFGTLCAIDPRPARLENPETIGMFNLYADLISLHLHNLEQLDLAKADLQEEKKTAELRDQFIAILGHDLRSPAGAVGNIAQLLKIGKLDTTGIKRFADILQNSSYRMLGLIDNVTDFARTRFGSGIVLNLRYEALDKILQHVVDEQRLIWPDRIIEVIFDLKALVYCDGRRVAQLFSNILGNALMHGKPDEPVTVNATSDEQKFILTVTNGGDPIPENMIKNLFDPFVRGKQKKGQHGLGLGLFISTEIARAHGGHIEVESAEKTTFKFIVDSKVENHH